MRPLRGGASLLLFYQTFEQFHYLGHRAHVARALVGDDDVVLLLDGHDQLDHVQRVGAQVLEYVCLDVYKRQGIDRLIPVRGEQRV